MENITYKLRDEEQERALFAFVDSEHFQKACELQWTNTRNYVQVMIDKDIFAFITDFKILKSQIRPVPVFDPNNWNMTAIPPEDVYMQIECNDGRGFKAVFKHGGWVVNKIENGKEIVDFILETNEVNRYRLWD